jgi:hypothetical protein
MKPSASCFLRNDFGFWMGGILVVIMASPACQLRARNQEAIKALRERPTAVSDTYSVTLWTGIPARVRGGSTVTLTLPTPESTLATTVSMIKFSVALDGLTFTDEEMLAGTATTHAWSVPAVDTLEARLKWVAIDSAGKMISQITDRVIIDSTPPTVTLQSLTGGQLIRGGSSQTIQWTTSDAVAMAPNSVSIQVSSNSGASWTDLVTGRAAAGTYSWTVPSVESATYRIRILALDEVGNEGSAVSATNFSIDSTGPSVALTAFNSGGVFRGGTTETISWTVSDPNLGANPVSLETSCDNGATWSALAADLAGSSYAWTLPSVDSAQCRVRITASDSIGNSSSATSAANFTIDSTAPSITLNAPVGGSALKTSTATNVQWTVSDANLGSTPIQLAYSANSGASWTPIASSVAGSPASYSWTTPATEGTSYRLRVTATDSVGNSASATSTDFTLDGTPPVITAGQMSINGGSGTTTSNWVQVSFKATDGLSNITHFCLTNSNSTPAAASGCWTPVNATVPNLIPAPSLDLPNFSFLIGFTAGVVNAFAWVRDAAGNASALSNGGAGTVGQDRASITYSPGSPPVVDLVSASVNDTPSSPLVKSDTQIAANGDVYIKWRATASNGFESGPITLTYTSDDTNYTQIATNITNAANPGCTISGALTGCYRWTGGAPNGNYFRIRVAARDQNGQTTITPTNNLNSWDPINVLAGNTDTGVGGSAASAAFIGPSLYLSDNADSGSFAVSSTGVFYYRDRSQGILQISPNDGVQNLLIRATGTSSGDGGPISSATIRYAIKIALDHQDRLLIFDYDRIRRYDPGSGLINTLIGGGTSTADTVAPLSLSIVPPSGLLLPTGNSAFHGTMNYPFFALPNGNIFFTSETFERGVALGSTRRYRYYDAGADLVRAIRPSGTGAFGLPSVDLTQCGLGTFGIAYDPVTSVIGHMQYLAETVTATPVCNNFKSLVGLNPVTHVATAPHPSPAPGVYDYYNQRIQGMDGNLYAVARFNVNGFGSLFKFNAGTGSWSTIGGTGTTGQCDDGTLATSCAMDPSDLFVNAQGQVYFVDRGRIRAIDSTNRIVTIMGQNLAFGNGGLALTARFGRITQIEQRTNGNILVSDTLGYYLREFAIGGTVTLLAGNGSTSTPETGVAANTQPFYGGFIRNGDFTLDPSTNDIYAGRSARIAKLSASTGQWSDLVGNTSGTIYPSADGLSGAAVRFFYPPTILGFDGTHILASLLNFSGGYSDAMFKRYTVTDGSQSSFAGVTGTHTASWCANGTATASCAIIGALNKLARPIYDPPRWIFLKHNDQTVITLTPGGTKATLTTLANAAVAMAYKSSTNELFYCAASNGRLYKKNLTTHIETLLPWPVASMKCDGLNMIYNATRNSVIFIFSQNDMMGVAEYTVL